MATATAKQQHSNDEPEPKRRKRQADGNRGTVSTHDDNMDRAPGYGNLQPHTTRNIFTRGHTVKYVLRWQKVLDLDFTTNQRPYIVPYQTLTFWTGAWAEHTTANMTNSVTLQEISNGYNFHYSDLTIELYSITRQRLLQQGATNTVTYDFESGECLYIYLADRDLETYKITSIHDCGPTSQRTPTSTGWDTHAVTRNTQQNSMDQTTHVAPTIVRICMGHYT